MERNGARDLLRRLVAAYVQSSATLMQSAAEAFGRGDPDGVARALHSLKSSSASLGALDFAQACARIESLARQSSLAPAEPLWVSLRTAFPGVIAALHALVAQEQAVAPHPAPAGR